MGYIEVFTGGMRSGKTEHMNTYLNKLSKYGQKSVQVFKPDLDRRFSDREVNVGRDGNKIECSLIPKGNPEYILSLLNNDTEVVGIDEAQFFDKKSCEYYDLVSVAQRIADKDIHVVISGLDMDSERNPFGPMPELMAIADEVTKMKSFCEKCGCSGGIYTYAGFEKESTVVVGDDGYLALCRKCYKMLKDI